MKVCSDATSVHLSHEISFAAQGTGMSILSHQTPTFELAHHLANDLGGSLNFGSILTQAMAGDEDDHLDDEQLSGGNQDNEEEHMAWDEEAEPHRMSAR